MSKLCNKRKVYEGLLFRTSQVGYHCVFEDLAILAAVGVKDYKRRRLFLHVEYGGRTTSIS